MEPEINPQPSAPAAPEEKISLTLADLRALVAGAVKDAVAPLVKQNELLQQEVINNSSMRYADGVPQEFQRTDAHVDPRRMQVARSVTVATRVVQENPELYKNVVDPGGLSVNNASPLSPKNFAECFEEPNGAN